MACRAWRWATTAEGLREQLRPVFANGERLSDAARKLDCTDAALRAICRGRGVDWRPLSRAAIVPPGAHEAIRETIPETIPEAVEEPPPLIDWTGARSSSGAVERRVILGDLHVPFHSIPACAAALALIRLVQPQRIVQLGDLWNMGAVSHHPRPLGGRENHAGALAQGRAFLEALRKAAPGSEIHVVLGNHDAWQDEWEDANPELSGLVATRQILE